MDIIYKAICERITLNPQLLTDEGLLSIAHIDYFKGQYLNPEEHLAYPTPALFFDYSAVWKDDGNNTQKGSVNISMHIELENYGESADGSPDQAYALQIFNYYKLINVLLHGLEGEEFSKLKRQAEEPNVAAINTIVHIITYTCEIEDDSTHIYRDYVFNTLDDLKLERVAHKPEAEANIGKYMI